MSAERSSNNLPTTVPTINCHLTSLAAWPPVISCPLLSSHAISCYLLPTPVTFCHSCHLMSYHAFSCYLPLSPAIPAITRSAKYSYQPAFPFLLSRSLEEQSCIHALTISIVYHYLARVDTSDSARQPYPHPPSSPISYMPLPSPSRRGIFPSAHLVPDAGSPVRPVLVEPFFLPNHIRTTDQTGLPIRPALLSL